MSNQTHTFECHRCFESITTDKKSIQCPNCGDFWYVVCQYCGKPITDVHEQIDGDCGCSGIDYAFEKWKERQLGI